MIFCLLFQQIIFIFFFWISNLNLLFLLKVLYKDLCVLAISIHSKMIEKLNSQRLTGPGERPGVTSISKEPKTFCLCSVWGWALCILVPISELLCLCCLLCSFWYSGPCSSSASVVFPSESTWEKISDDSWSLEAFNRKIPMHKSLANKFRKDHGWEHNISKSRQTQATGGKNCEKAGKLPRLCGDIIQ